MKKTNLASLILAGSLAFTGCSTLSPSRVNLDEANSFKGTSAQYFAYANDKGTALDAAETDRESRCLTNIGEFKYTSKVDAYKELASCVSNERYKDMAMYGIASILIDGLKLYGLVNGLRGSDGKGTLVGGSSSTNPIQSKISSGSVGSKTIYTPIK